MLHILLLILKIMGIILAVILGILVLLVCIVLFDPVRYHILAKSDGSVKDIKAQGQITWLFGLVELRFLYKNQKSGYRMRIAWKHFGETKPAKGGDNHEKQNHSKTNEEVCQKPEETAKPSNNEETADPHPERAKTEGMEKADKISAKMDKETTSSPEKRTETHTKDHAKKSAKLWQKVQALFHKIKCTFQKFCDKINLLSEKKEKIMEFLEKEEHKKAFRHVKKESIRLLKRICPDHGLVHLHFGLEDPYHTGQILAAASVIYPFFPGNLELEPDFEQKILKGHVDIRGRIFFLHPLLYAGNIIRSKAVRTTYKDIRNIMNSW